MPSEKFRSGEWSIDSTVYSEKLNVVSTMTWNGTPTVNARVMLSQENGYAITASLATPYTETYSVEMTHKQTSKTFTNKASVQWAPTKKISTDIDISTL